MDVTTDGPIDGMIYRDYPLQHCSIQTIGIVQYDKPEVQGQVLLHAELPDHRVESLAILP